MSQQRVRDLGVHEICLPFGRCLQENFKEKSSTRMMTLDSVRSSEFYQNFTEFCDPFIGVVVIFFLETWKNFIGFGSCSPKTSIYLQNHLPAVETGDSSLGPHPPFCWGPGTHSQYWWPCCGHTARCSSKWMEVTQISLEKWPENFRFNKRCYVSGTRWHNFHVQNHHFLLKKIPLP